MSPPRSLARLVAASERAASRAADARWALARVRRDKAFTDRSRDNRLEHQRRVDK
ncbi:hypothetical protein [Mycolicibacterium doricum]|uniref:hypothetical protein n=1 Tax=Mycolicibacterium doricum TaxID=126673 RepID=UPI0013D29D77|nr:hypothetical protein [Mycolicibacterium doricum]MCV7269745.1 hypothetical protein [Mycolicibacterium doricum]